MSNVGVHSVEIPHEHVKPLRDMVIIRIPLPPEKVGSIHVPNMAREMMQHNVMYGLVVACGPIAFGYKDAEGFTRGSEVAGPGDWVLFRPFAGTLITGGKVNVNFGFRYISSFNDVIGVIPKDRMPDPGVFTWTEDKGADFSYRDEREPAPGFDFNAKREA